MKPAVVVVGSYVQDLIWRCRSFPQPGETVIGEFAAGPGGKGSNQAVAAARAGAATCFIGAIGRDSLGTEARAFYDREKIPARFAEKPGHATGTAAILVNAVGENKIIVALAANAALASRDVDPALIAGAQVVVTQLESNLATTRHVLRAARRHGVLTVLNPAPLPQPFDPGVLREVDILIPNESEFVALIRQRRPKVNEATLKHLGPSDLHLLCRTLGVATVIVTLGARGCFISQADRHAMINGHSGLKVVDTTGAGDAFVGGFAAGLVQFKGDQLRAANFANAVAALSVTKPGAAPAMPRRAEVMRFLR